MDFSHTRAFPGLAGLDIAEADLVLCTEEEVIWLREERAEVAENERKAAAEAAKAVPVKKPEIKEFDSIRLIVPLKGSDVFDDKAVYDLPVGTEGTVVDVYWEGAAFEVEFLLFTDPARPDSFVSVQIPVEASQCEPAWNLQATNDGKDG